MGDDIVEEREVRRRRGEGEGEEKERVSAVKYASVHLSPVHRLHLSIPPSISVPDYPSGYSICIA
jgi:hypothetical protein